MAEAQQKQWSGSTDGKPWMQESLILLFRIFGVRVGYFFAACVVPFYMLFNRKAYRATFHYFHDRHHYGILRSVSAVYRDYLTFAEVMLDRFAMYAGKKFEIDIESHHLFAALAKKKEGFMMISSHMGNFELAGYSLLSPKKVYTLVFAGEKETVKKNRKKLFGIHNVEMVPVKPDLSHLFVLNQAVENGNIVCMPGDRIWGSAKSVVCNFFDAPARFPLGPFAVAVQKNLSVLGVFCMKTGTKHYKIFLRSIEADNTLPPGKRMEAFASAFATELEAMAKRFPLQWFNHYNFWEKPQTC